MPLRADSDHPEQWVDSDWTGNSPATFAVIIGISAYPHLKGDAATYGLGQLHVSSLTAYSFFRWLRDKYRNTDRPIARCWLLLAPTELERQAEPSLPRTPLPTFDACSQAIEEWFASMRDLNSVHAEKSRALFFFSGHGLEIEPEKPLLLPSDYLRPPVANVNRAISSYNIYAGLRALPVPEHLFFLDACRNDHEDLRELSLEGTPILNAWPSYRSRPDVKSPIVYATGPGAAAWQSEDPTQGASIFGRALIEGLAGRPPAAHDPRGWVTMRTLEDFLDPRVSALLMNAGSRVKQPVRIWGPGLIDVCEVGIFTPPPASDARDATRVPAARDLITPTIDVLEPTQAIGAPQGWLPSTAGGEEAAHAMLGSEVLTRLLWNARLFDFQQRRWWELREEEGRPPLTILHMARIPNPIGAHRRFRVEAQIQGKGPYWLELAPGDHAKHKAACVLSGDEHGPCRYTIDIDVEEPLVTDLDVVLSENNTGMLRNAAGLWSQFRALEIQRLATRDELHLLERALREKMVSPLAATVAAVLLLRAWRHDLLHDWPRNLSDMFPDRPDACVVVAEQILRTGSEAPVTAVPWLLRLAKRGLPLTGECLAIASSRVAELLQFAYPEPGARNDAQNAEISSLEDLGQKLRRAMTVFRTGGLATTFIGKRELIVPELIAASPPTSRNTPPTKATPESTGMATNTG